MGPVAVDVHMLMDRNQRLIGSVWMTTAEGQEIADYVSVGAVSFDAFETQAAPWSRLTMPSLASQIAKLASPTS